MKKKIRSFLGLFYVGIAVIIGDDRAVRWVLCHYFAEHLKGVLIEGAVVETSG
jgi:hypothetical protein